MAERIDIIVSERGSRRVRRNLDAIGRSAQTSQGAVKLLARSLGGLAAAVSLVSVVRTLANFAQAMSTVSAVAGATLFYIAALPTFVADLPYDPLSPEPLEAHKRDVLDITRRLLGIRGPRAV